jgi:hypothetical protein
MKTELFSLRGKGRIVLLCSIAHPFIRDIGDIGILDEKSGITNLF